MNIYKLVNTTCDAYDQYKEIIVVAESKDEARKMHPFLTFRKFYYYYNKSSYNDFLDHFIGPYSAWCDPAELEISLLGKAGDWFWKPEVILTDFNAG